MERDVRILLSPLHFVTTKHRLAVGVVYYIHDRNYSYHRYIFPEESEFEASRTLLYHPFFLTLSEKVHGIRTCAQLLK